MITRQPSLSNAVTVSWQNRIMSVIIIIMMMHCTVNSEVMSYLRALQLWRLCPSFYFFGKTSVNTNALWLTLVVLMLSITLSGVSMNVIRLYTSANWPVICALYFVHYVQCVTSTFAERLRLVFSLSGFANLSTKITTKREFRLSLSFLLSENT